VPGPEEAERVVAGTSQLLSVPWSLLWVAILIPWAAAAWHVTVHIFTSHDLRRPAKAAWLVFVVLLPFLGVLAYVLGRGDLIPRNGRPSETREATPQAQVRRSTGANGPGDHVGRVPLREADAGTREDREAVLS
jgi:Na+/proline symporter